MIAGAGLLTAGFALAANGSEPGNLSLSPASGAVTLQPTFSTTDGCPAGNQASAVVVEFNTNGTFASRVGNVVNSPTAAFSGTLLGDVGDLLGSTNIANGGTVEWAVGCYNQVAGTGSVKYVQSTFVTLSSDGSSYTTSSSPPGLPPTATALTLSAPQVPYGDEQTEQVSVAVTASSGTPDGSVTVTSGSTTVCTITLASGTGSCAVPATLFAAGSVPLTASYGGSSAFSGSTSSAETFTVSQATSQTSLSLSAAAIAYGQAEKLSVSVAPQFSGTPTGTVNVTAGATTVCTITLSAGAGSCTVNATQFALGPVQLTAAYAGSTDFSASTSSAETFTVSQATSHTSLTLSTTKITYGHEQAEHLSVSVAPQFSGTPTGTVNVTAGSTTVCTITLSGGTGSCTLKAIQFVPGSVQLTATYGGSTDFSSSAGAAQTLAVSKAKSSVVLSLSKTKITYGHEKSEHLSIKVSPQYSGTPAGTVTIRAGRTTVCVIRLRSGKGTCTLSAKKLRVGTYHLIASYGGNADFARSASAAKKLKVVR